MRLASAPIATASSEPRTSLTMTRSCCASPATPRGPGALHALASTATSAHPAAAATTLRVAVETDMRTSLGGGERGNVDAYQGLPRAGSRAAKVTRQAACPRRTSLAIAAQQRDRRGGVAEHEERVDRVAGNAERRIRVDRDQAARRQHIDAHRRARRDDRV